MLNTLHQLIKMIGNERVHAIDNEISLQIELTIALRQALQNYGVFCEKNIRSYFEDSNGFEKKEIDISIHNLNDVNNFYHAIELKHPRNGQTPEQMFSFVNDIRFLEQIKSRKNTPDHCYFIALCGPEFYNSNRKMDGIYAYFRSDGVDPPKPLTGSISRGDRSIHLVGSYQVDWHKFAGELRYAIVEV